MKIIGIINKDSGPGFHRIMQPLIMMDGPDVYVTNEINEQVFIDKQPDIVYYNRFVNPVIFELRDKYGFKIVVDVDDYWHLDYHHIAYQQYIDNDVADLQIEHLRKADLITTTHERLAEVISPYNKNVIITPNAIPHNEYFPTERTQSDMTRLFYQGSITHEKDISMLRNPFKRLNAKQYATVIAGYTKHEAWDKMIAAFTNGLRLKGLILPGVLPMEYYKNYAHADICLAPLIDSKFNGFKSNLKVLEAAHMGLPVIASHVNPYLDMPVLYAYQQTDWYKQIQYLSRPEVRNEYGQLLKQHCDKHYNFTKINQYRYAEFSNL